MADQFDPSAQNFNNSDPAAQMMNYQYMQNQQLMQMQQTNLQSAINTATNNAQAQMQTVLQGTMAASMAVYNTGKSLVDRARERQYQDQLLGNGNYVLERNNMRDLMWGTGVSQSDFGRALKIGGRRPEFLSSEEYSYQRQRSWNYRKEELFDETVGGGTAMLADALTYIPGVNFTVGLAAQVVTGGLMKPYFEQRRAGREMRQWAETTNMNWGSGARNISKQDADALGRKEYLEEHPWWSHIPGGGIINKRLRPELENSVVRKQMMETGLMRDIDPSDLDEIDKRVAKSKEFINRFAGTMHTTRQAIMDMKITLDRMGLNNGQQEVAIANIAKSGLQTNLPTEYLTQAYGNFMQAGTQMGFTNRFSPGAQGNFGLEELNMIKAGIDSGNILKSHDPGTLAMQHFVNAGERTKSGFGTVIQFGHGNVIDAAKALAATRGNQGWASTAVGLMLQGTKYGEKVNPLDVYEESVWKIYNTISNNGQNPEAGFGAVLGMEETIEGKEQAADILYGYTAYNKRESKAAGLETYYRDRGFGQDQGFIRSFAVKDVAKYGDYSVLKSDTTRVKTGIEDLAARIEGKQIDKNSGDKLYNAFKAVRKDAGLTDRISKYYQGVRSGAAPDDKLIIQDIAAQHDITEAEATQVFNTRLRDADQDLNSFKWFGNKEGGYLVDTNWNFGHINTAKELAANTQTVISYLKDNKNDVRASGDVQKTYSEVYTKVQAYVDAHPEIVEKWANKSTQQRIELIKAMGIDLSYYFSNADEGNIHQIESDIVTVANNAVYDKTIGKAAGDLGPGSEKLSPEAQRAKQRKAVESYEGMLKVYNKGNKFLADHGVKSEQQYVSKVQGLKSDIESINKDYSLIKSSEMRKKLLEEITITGQSEEYASGALRALDDAGEDVEKRKSALGKIYTSLHGATGDIPGLEVGKEAADKSIAAIDKLALACDAIATAIGNNYGK